VLLTIIVFFEVFTQKSEVIVAVWQQEYSRSIVNVDIKSLRRPQPRLLSKDIADGLLTWIHVLVWTVIDLTVVDGHIQVCVARGNLIQIMTDDFILIAIRPQRSRHPHICAGNARQNQRFRQSPLHNNIQLTKK
jgi:hypothetical protein